VCAVGNNKRGINIDPSPSSIAIMQRQIAYCGENHETGKNRKSLKQTPELENNLPLADLVPASSAG
jgi:hypothetical protein